jgi:hypothetical protein
VKHADSIAGGGDDDADTAGGVGERKHVRSQLLGIACWSHTNLHAQIHAAFKAGDALHMMARVHVQASPSDFMMTKLFGQNQTHQYEPHPNLSRAAFDKVCFDSELHVLPKGDKGQPDELAALMIKAWQESGARFLKGNFASATDDELRAKYPQLWHETNSIWRIYDNQREAVHRDNS